MFLLLEGVTQIDRSIFNIINHGLVNTVFDKLMPFLSFIGNIGAVWIIIGVLLFIFGGKKGRNAALMIFIIGILTDLTTEVIIKNIVMRQRPFIVMSGVRLLVAKPASYSFPSGHAATSFAAGIVLSRYYRKFTWLLLLLALGISFSRVYVGVHFPVDVLAGVVIGAALAYLLLSKQQKIESLFDEVRERYFNRHSRANR